MDELVEAVAEMRRLQRAWFGGDKSRETLGAAKQAERKVDRLLAKLRTEYPNLFDRVLP